MTSTGRENDPQICERLARDANYLKVQERIKTKGSYSRAMLGVLRLPLVYIRSRVPSHAPGGEGKEGTGSFLRSRLQLHGKWPGVKAKPVTTEARGLCVRPRIYSRNISAMCTVLNISRIELS